MIIRYNLFPSILILLCIIIGCSKKPPIMYSPLQNHHQKTFVADALIEDGNHQLDEYILEKEKLYEKLIKKTIVIDNTEDEEYEEDNEEDKLDLTDQSTIQEYTDIDYLEKGQQAVVAENWSEALKAFHKAIKLNPQNTEAYFYRGNIYDELGHYAKAIADYNKVIRLNPVHIDAYLRRGFAYNNLGQSKRALDNIRMAAKLGDNTAQKFLKERGMTW